MGLLDWITRSQEKLTNLQKRIETNQLDGIFMKPKEKQETGSPKQSKTAKQIIKRFYSDYPEPPFISNDRTKDWIEKAKLFPKQCIISKAMMTRFADGLLPGHVYMLYWLKKRTNKKAPAYFEYKYGIDFEKEKNYLHECNYLDEANKPTDKGEKAINDHFDVIERHQTATAKPDCSIESIANQIMAQRDSLIRNGFSQYEFIANRDCCNVCGGLNGKHFPVKKLEIGVNAPPMHEGCRCSIAAYM